MEIAVEKVIAEGAQEEIRQTAEIVFQDLFAERDAGEAEKIILEIIKIPGDGLAIEAGARIAHRVIQIAAGFHLKAGQDGHHFAVGFNDLRSNAFAGAVLQEKLKKRGVSEVFFEIRAVAQIFRINFRDRQAVAAKMSGKFEEGDVFFAHAIQNADGAAFSAGKADDLAPRTAELALEGLHPLDGGAEMLFKKPFENIHEYDSPRFPFDGALTLTVFYHS